MSGRTSSGSAPPGAIAALTPEQLEEANNLKLDVNERGLKKMYATALSLMKSRNADDRKQYLASLQVDMMSVAFTMQKLETVSQVTCPTEQRDYEDELAQLRECLPPLLSKTSSNSRELWLTFTSTYRASTRSHSARDHPAAPGADRGAGGACEQAAVRRARQAGQPVSEPRGHLRDARQHPAAALCDPRRVQGLPGHCGARAGGLHARDGGPRRAAEHDQQRDR